MTRKALVREVNPHLICVLCSGYFIEASTVVECLHSFCRSCLIKYLENSKFCPICDVQLNRYNPMLSVRCDPTLQQLVYKLVPGLYTAEMARRRKYYSQLGGPSSSDNDAEFPAADAYFAPQDPISLSLEFAPHSSKEEENAANEEVVLEKQAGPHRRYLQCPAAVTMSHLKKFLRMKYTLSQEFRIEIIYDGEVLSDDFSLIDVAYTFAWNKTSPMRFKFRIIQKAATPTEATTTEIEVTKEDYQEVNPPSPPPPIVKTKNSVKQKDDLPKNKTKFHSHKANIAPEVPPLKVELKQKNKEKNVEKLEKTHLPNGKRPHPQEPIVIDDVDEEDEQNFEGEGTPTRSKSSTPEPQPKKQKMEASVKGKEQEKVTEPIKIVLDEKSYRMETNQEEEDDEDRLRISASEEDNTVDEKPSERQRDRDHSVERASSKSEERRREKKKNKKNKHHHHHRHHDRKRDSPPASATILPTPENDIMKLKVKLTAIKSNCNTKVTGYSVVEDNDDKKEPKENGLPPKSPKSPKPPKSPKETEKPAKENHFVEEPPKAKEEDKRPADIINNNKPDFVKKFDAMNKEKLLQMRQVRHNNKHSPKQNGGIPSESLKLPPSSITVSKITAAEKRQIEEQKLLTRNNNNGLDSKRPSLEIMLVNAPKKQPSTAISMEESPKPPEVKKVMRPTPPSIPLSKINHKALSASGFTFSTKTSPPPKQSLPQLISAAKAASGESGVLDLSEKSSRKSPESPASRSPPLVRQHTESSAMRNLMTLTETAVHVRSMMAAQQESTQLKIPTPSLTMNNKVGYQARPCKPGPNQTVRQIPNPSALAYRQQHMNGRSLGMPPQVIPALRKMESMTKNIEKVAAGLSVKAIEAYGK